MKTILFSGIFLVLSSWLGAQISIQPIYFNEAVIWMPQNLMLTITNMGIQQENGIVQVDIVDQSSQLTVMAESNLIKIGPGQVIISEQISWKPIPVYGITSSGQYLRETGRFAPGQYTICYRFVGEDSKEKALTCQEKQMQPVGLPELVYPLDKENITSRLPIFQWRPPFPLPSGASLQYDLRLYQLDDLENPNEAVQNKLPLLWLKALPFNSLQYNASYPVLELESRYAWQVTAYIKDVLVGPTSLWTFKVTNENITPGTDQEPETFRLMKRSLDGHQYRVGRYLCFGFDNDSGTEFLDYEILESNKSIRSATSKFTPIALEPGMNQLKLACKELGLEPGKNYLLKTHDNKGNLFLEFTYAE
jgi:hypothetical protein